MKKLLFLVLPLFLLTACVRPGEEPVVPTQPRLDTPETGASLLSTPPEPELAPFSWEQTAELWQEGDPGVRSHGFHNTTPQPVTDPEQAVELAQRECGTSWNTYAVTWDPVAQVWGVCFYTEGTLGGCQTVYLDTEGLTRLVVSGE